MNAAGSSTNTTRAHLHHHNVAPAAIGGRLLRVCLNQRRQRGVRLLLLRPLQALHGEGLALAGIVRVKDELHAMHDRCTSAYSKHRAS